MNISQLQEAFENFTVASKTLESYYEMLQEKIKFLTIELEKKNTELKKALDELKKTNDYLSAVLYNIEEIIIGIDDKQRIILMNRSAERYLKLNFSDIKGSTIEKLNLKIAKEGPETYLLIGEKKYSVIVSNSKVVDLDGNVKGEVLLIKDISRLRELEAQNERNQRLIAMGEMAAKIVHEIRNPLCSIELYSSMLELEIQDPSQKKLAEGISKGINSMNNILTNMSIFARPNKPSMKNVKLDSLIHDSLQIISPLLKSPKIEVSCSLLNCHILGDPELLKQVFLNIMINAIHAKPDNCSTYCIEILMGEEEEFIVVSFKDYGVGIKPEYLEKIFDPFFTTKDTGSGLGLSISSMIMQSHGGYIKVSSEVGKGSCFSLYFKKPLKEKGFLKQDSEKTLNNLPIRRKLCQKTVNTY
ncbi:MAG: ATP-binding protein [Thermodesulfovibrionales bacterium]|nr:ATP-binding protein [Thermodesulfovibrionales bacterium]